ncbi:hypothetical protein [Bordetella bronchialis]|uniref:hypothetical protein n=1 Tax=Bordetella bronchialis TaxID=463025 RepID=UPI001E582AD6|nr:hypothetical protein [Bordetella bronchialis]
MARLPGDSVDSFSHGKTERPPEKHVARPVKVANYSNRIECLQPQKTPDAAAAFGSLECGIERLEGLQVRVVESAAVIADFEAHDRFLWRCTSSPLCVQEHRLLRNTEDINDYLAISGLQAGCRDGLDRINDGLEQGQESVTAGQWRVSQPPGEVGVHAH